MRHRLAPLLLPLLTACSGTPAADAPDLAAAATTRPITIDFQAKVGAATLDCDGEYDGVGTGKEHIHPGDLRLYVHNARLVTASGAELPVALTADGTWQSSTLALLDFTSNVGECSGSAETNTTLKGTYTDRGEAITGLRFTVGVPFAENHQDVTKAKAPLNDSVLYWSWNSGYKFLLLEGKNHLDKTFTLHLGSTGCMKDGNNTVTSCSAPNRVEVSLTGWAATGKKVVVDLKEALGAMNLDNEVACHSSPAQGDCAQLFKNLGLPIGDTPAGTSKVFRVE